MFLCHIFTQRPMTDRKIEAAKAAASAARAGSTLARKHSSHAASATTIAV